MQLTVPVYQRRAAGELEWMTLGLEAHNQVLRGKNPIKLQVSLSDRLKGVISKLRPKDMRAFELHRGARLRRVHLDLTLRGSSKRIRASGVFPLVTEPRSVSDHARMHIAYHPYRQAEWFPFHSDQPLDDQAKTYFQRVWADLSKEEVLALTTDQKDLLRTVAFNAQLPVLVDELPDDEDPFGDLDLDPRKERSGRKRKSKPRRSYPELRKVAANQTLRAADGTLRLGLPRSPYREQIAQLLTGRRKTCTILLGAPGVGKRTLLNRWVMDLLETDDFFTHRNLDRSHSVYRTAGERILAGMTYLGEWEERVVKILREVKGQPVVLWVDDLYSFGRLGQTRGSDRRFADLFRGPMQRGEVVLVGTATAEQWHRLQEDAPAFSDAFSVVRVDAASSLESYQYMLHEARRLERETRVVVAPFAYRSVVELGGALTAHTELPGAAVDMLRKVVRDVDGRAPEGEEAPRVDTEEVIQTIAAETGLPETLLRPEVPLRSDDVRAAVTARVIGQTAGVDAAVDVVMRIRAGLTDARRPYATYLLTGPTGTGKTELAKTLASYLYGGDERLLRFDMGEFSGPDAVARLIGDRFEPRGLLTEAVRRQPYAVVLLDEVEKAHPAVLHLLLQLLDEGRLTDATGATAKFTHAVIIMTSNLGAKARPAVGFGSQDKRAKETATDTNRAVKDFFPPELFNRIDRVVPFGSLSREVAARIAEKELTQLLSRRGLYDRNVFVFAHESAVNRLVAHAFNPTDGARSVQRYVETEIAPMLADELAQGGRPAMQILRVYATEEGSAGATPGGFHLHAETLEEQELGNFTGPMADWMERPVSELYGVVRKASVAVRELDEGKAMQALAEEMRSGFNSGGTGAAGAEEMYALDLIRQKVRSLRERMENLGLSAAEDGSWELEHDRTREVRTGDPYSSVRSARRVTRRAFAPSQHVSKDEVIEMLAEAEFLRRVPDRFADASAHKVTLSLLRIGQGRRSSPGTEAADGLLQWLVGFYSTHGGELAELAVCDDQGSVQVTEDEDEIAKVLTPFASHAVVRLLGPCVRDLLYEERGCHLWTSVLAGAEVVRVDVNPATDDRGAREVLQAERQAALEFEDALELGSTPLPENPARLLPAVRRVRWDPPVRPGETSIADVEDYAAGYVHSLRAKVFQEVIRPVWLLRKARVHGG